ELKTEFNNWINGLKVFPQRDHYVYIDIRNNEVFRGPPNKTTNAMHPGPKDLGGPVFLYTPENLGLVDLFGIQVTSSSQLTAALPYEIIQDITGYTLYDGNNN
ncbi:13196_t:CDS:2, partial [Racocetra fulgida]